MSVYCDTLEFKTKGEVELVDITSKIQQVVKKSKITNGIACVFVNGSTGSITTVEYEPGLQNDIPVALERFAPKNSTYAHHETWHDDNGHSHVRASLIGPSITLPVQDGQIVHGTWQQVVFVELDTSPRNRTVYVHIVGE